MDVFVEQFFFNSKQKLCIERNYAKHFYFRDSKDVLQKVEALTENIRNISAKVSNESERTAIEREAKLTEREHLIEFREQRYFIWK